MPAILRRSKRAAARPKPYSYGPAPLLIARHDTYFYTSESARCHKPVVNNARSTMNCGSVTPEFITSLKFDASKWTGRSKPPNVRCVWPPTSASQLMNTAVSVGDIDSLTKQSNFMRRKGELIEEESCLGKWCWQSTDWSDFLCAQDFDSRAQCDHKLTEWMRGCAGWKKRFEIRNVSGMGRGLYSKQAWEKGDVLGIYLGELIPGRSDKRTDYCHQVKIGPDFSKAEAQVAYIDAEKYGNYTRFANHSCDNNANIVEARVGKERVLVMRAIRGIEIGEQVCIDYQYEYFLERQCLCGTKKCQYSRPIPTIDKAG
jgi:hypothetical protein